MQEKNDSALYVGPSHAEGGIPVIVDPQKPGEHPVEVEGIEYKICAEAYQSSEKLSFAQKTNFEILDSIHKDFSCKFNQGEADGGDFIICKVAVKDQVRRDRSGTVKQILDEIQGENGCRLSTGQIAEKKRKQGGLLKKQEPLYGKITWDSDSEFYKQYAGNKIAIQYGAIDFKNGTLLHPGKYTGNDFDIAQLEFGNADLYDISKLNVANITDDKTAREILDKAVSLPGNTVQELNWLNSVYPKSANQIFAIDYLLLSEIKTIASAAKILGYDGIYLWGDETTAHPTEAFIWNAIGMLPLIINNEKNYAYFKSLGHCGCEHKEEGGTVKEPEAEKGTGYDARVLRNLSQMNAPFEEWRATPIKGFTEVEINGKMKKMPLFDFPQGYTIAPTLYLANEDNACCGLCGKDPISTWYWIQNDSKKWSLGVGSECVTHFGEGKSGKDLERELKVNTAKKFDAKLYMLAMWVKKNFYKGPDYPNCSPLVCSSYMQSWQNLWDVKTDYTMDRTFSALYIYNPLLPFDYLKELDKAIKKGADEEAARKATERKLLSWYAREHAQKIKNISNTLRHLQSQAENFFLQNGYAASDREQVAWNARAKDFQELAGDYLPEQQKLLKGGRLDKRDNEYFEKMLPTMVADLKAGRDFASALMSIKSGIMEGEFPVYKKWFVDRGVIDENGNYIIGFSSTQTTSSPVKNEKYIASPKISGWVKINDVSADDVTELLNSDLVTVNNNGSGDTRIKYYDPLTKSTLDFGKYDDGYHLIGCCDYGWGSSMPGNKATAELKSAISKLKSMDSLGAPTKKSIDDAWELIKPEIEKVKLELPGSHDFSWWRSRVNEFFYQGKLKALPWGIKNSTEKLFPEVWAAHKSEINPAANDSPLDFKSVDMQSDYNRLNQEMFNGELAPVPLKWIHQKYKIGITVFNSDGSVDYAGVSNFYNITRQQYLDVLAHEMIHVWIAQKGLREPNHHGPIFMAKLDELNVRFPNFKITKTENAADYNISGLVTPKEYGVVLFDEDGKFSVVVVNAEVMDNKEAIEEFIGGMKSHGAIHFKNLKLRLYKSSYPDLAKFKIKKSLSLRAMEVFVLTDEMAAEIQQDEPIREVDFSIYEKGSKKHSLINETDYTVGNYGQNNSEIFLYHRSPVKFGRGKPHFDAYFGTEAFAETYKNDFGQYLYVAKMPATMRAKMLDLNLGTEDARQFMVAVAAKIYPTDNDFQTELLEGDKKAIEDFYEIWTDKNQILPEMRNRGIPAVQFHDEYLLTQEAIAQLDFIETPLSKITESIEQISKVPALKTDGLLSMLVADINENIGNVQEYTYAQTESLSNEIAGIKKKITGLSKRDPNGVILKEEMDLLQQQIFKLQGENELRFANQNTVVEKILRNFSLEQKLLSVDETKHESEDWQDLQSEFWMGILERPETEVYWENTAEFVWRNVVLDYRMGKQYGSEKLFSEFDVFSDGLNKMLPVPVVGLSEYLMLRSAGNSLEFAGYKNNAENGIDPSWQISIKNDAGLLDQQEINMIFDLRAKVTIVNGITSIILPYDILSTDYKKAYAHFEVIKNELIDYRIRLKELFIKAQEEQRKLKSQYSSDGLVLLFRASYHDFYIAFHQSAQIIHSELGLPIYHLPIAKYEQKQFDRPTNDYVVLKSAILPEVNKLKSKGISIIISEPVFGFNTAKQIISIEDSERLNQKLKTILSLLAK